MPSPDAVGSLARASPSLRSPPPSGSASGAEPLANPVDPGSGRGAERGKHRGHGRPIRRSRAHRREETPARQPTHGFHQCDAGRRGTGQRSEEHTSELQSLTNLVCRLLLEKKKKITKRLFNHKKKKKIKQ